VGNVTRSVPGFMARGWRRRRPPRRYDALRAVRNVTLYLDLPGPRGKLDRLLSEFGAVALPGPPPGLDEVPAGQALAAPHGRRASSVRGGPREREELAARFFDTLRDGKILNTWALDILDGRIQTIRTVSNPDKLGHVGPVADAWAAAREANHARRPG
jgi:hypothetical protein